MTGFLWLLFGSTAVTTLAVLVLVAWLGFRRIRSAIDDATGSLRQLGPAIERLEHTTAVTQREIARVGGAVDALARDRDERRSRR